MSVVRVGSTKKFADNWDAIFSESKKTGKEGNAGRSAKKPAAKKAPKKGAKKKR
ncbi:MAG: hypothetical protein ACR2NU_07590 [Aeoliella sp.]